MSMNRFGRKSGAAIVDIEINHQKNKDMKLKLNEAIARSEANGEKVLKKDIALRLFEGASECSRQVRFSNLCRGYTKRVKPEWVVIICEMCGCSADYLFGLED